jgi:ribosomal protein L11 methyltransferase
MDWIEVTIKTTAEGADVAAQVFYDVGVTGVVVEDPYAIHEVQSDERSWDYVDESMLNGMEEEVLVKAYLSNDPSFEEKLARIKEKIKWLQQLDHGLDMGTLVIELTKVKEEDWANNWKKYYKPLKVSRRIVIKPSWEQYESKDDEIVLEMDPGMAFGTGTHETTTLCIDALDRYLKGGETVVDIGCGTGVLAVSALLLGAEIATAIDLDSNAVQIAKENAERNRVNHRMEVIHGNLLDQVYGQFDIAVANIIADVIIDLTKSIRRFLKPNGLFIASGIILDRLQDVLEEMEASGLELIEKKTKGEWAVVVCKANA